MKPTVLIIEDDTLLRDAYRMMLEAKGYGVRTAVDGLDGIDKLDEQPLPNVILLDMLMPRMDGLEFLKTSGVSAKHPQIPVVLFSNFSNLQRHKELEDYKIAERVLKSKIGPLELFDLIERHTKRGN